MEGEMNHISLGIGRTTLANHSSSEHFLEGEDNYKMRTALKNWLKHFDITLWKAHCSGHAAPADLERMIKKVKPDVLIPIHTLNPEGFRDWHNGVLVVEHQKEYLIK